MRSLKNLEPTKDLCVFFVCTENEIINEDLESTLWNYLNLTPSLYYKIDFYLFLNKIVDTTKIEIIQERVAKNPWVNKIEIFSLDLSEIEDVFWYPWLQTPKPKIMPEYGYTSGANLLFYKSIREMMNNSQGYKTFLMLEADSVVLKENWFDTLLKFSKNTDFTIAGSKYKGNQLCHKDSPYKDHLNGIALYRNSEELKEILAGGEEVIKKEMPTIGFLNFDIANFLFYSKSKKQYKVMDTAHITNMSDQRDFYITEDEVLKKYPETIILHKKNIKRNSMISQDLFARDFEKEDIPVCFLRPHTASEYITDINFVACKQYLQRDFRYNKAVKLKIVSNSGSKMILFACGKEYFDAYPRSFFMEIEGDSYTISYFNLAKLIEDSYIKIISIILDFRSSQTIDTTIFSYFNEVIKKIKKTPYLYAFQKSLIDLASSAFAKYELLKHHGVIKNSDLRLNSFLHFIKEDFSCDFLENCFLGKSNLNDFETDYLFKAIENFQFFDIKMVDEVLYRLFDQTHGIQLKNINLESINFNSTIHKIIVNENELPEADLNILNNKSKIYNIINNKLLISDLGERDSGSKEKSVPVLLHIPKNAGSFMIAVMTKYFIKMYGGDKYFNIQRLQIDFDDKSHATVFVFFKNESWRDDGAIKDHKYPAPRSKSTNFNTLEKYIKEDSVEILGAVAEPMKNGIIRDGLTNIWKILEIAKKKPVNFLISRDPLARATSLYNYLTSEESAHELSHKSIEAKTLDEYIGSNAVEDSWLIRSIVNVPKKKIIEYQHFDAALDFLIENRFVAGDIKNANTIITKVLEKTYGVPLQESDLSNAKRNKSVQREKPSSVSQKSLNNFSHRTKWDSKIYKILLKNNNDI